MRPARSVEIASRRARMSSVAFHEALRQRARKTEKAAHWSENTTAAVPGSPESDLLWAQIALYWVFSCIAAARARARVDGGFVALRLFGEGREARG